MIGLFNFYKKNSEKKIVKLKEFLESETNVTLLGWESPIGRMDGVVLSGSERLITKDDYEDGWLSFIRNASIPIIGICFGFQLICRAFGAVFERKENIKRLVEISKLREHPLINGIPNVAKLPESHEEYVTAVMDPLLPIMASDYCIEAVIHREKPIFGTQFHFERSDKYGRRILKNFLKLIEQ